MFQCEYCNFYDTDPTVCSNCHQARYNAQDHNERVLNSQVAIGGNVTGFSSDGTFELNQQNITGNRDAQAFCSGEQQFGDWGIDPSSIDSNFLDSLITQNEDGRGMMDTSTFSDVGNAPPIADMVNNQQAPRNEANTTLQYIPLYFPLSPNLQLTSDLGHTWLLTIVKTMLNDLNNFGFCTVDNFLGDFRASQLLAEVESLRKNMSDGQIISRNLPSPGAIRGDKTTWVTGAEKGCTQISRLIEIVDTVMQTANRDVDAKLLAKHHIASRTKAMVACYPGGGTHYIKHIDNPNRDGRCVTAIYYVNKNWKPCDEGTLRIYPSIDKLHVATIEPIFDRMVFFWSDRRSPHEVLPSRAIRYAITIWYIDQHQVDDLQTVNMN